MANEHVFVDSTVVNKEAPTNKDPNDIKMKFPPSIEAKDLILKPTDGKKPRRSPNAFIIYRKLFVQTARANGYKLQMTEISKAASKSWENEVVYVKKFYKRLAKDAYKYRSEMFPKTDRKKKRQQWNIVSFKSTSEEQESYNDTDSSTSNQSPMFSSPMSQKEEVFNPTDDDHIINNHHINDHIIFNNLTQDTEINTFPFNIQLNTFEPYAAAGAVDLQQALSNFDIIWINRFATSFELKTEKIITVVIATFDCIFVLVNVLDDQFVISHYSELFFLANC
ncbi:1415_t:CDS:2, partial [Dentiscutata erythropus]